MSGLTTGRTYTLTIEKISEYGTIEAYNAPHNFLAESTELNNYLIKTVLLNARYFVLKAKITDDKNEIVFTKGATEALNLVANTLGQKYLEEGDEILLTELEHHSNYVPWHYLRKSKIKYF